MSYEKDQIAKKERRERIAVRCLQGLLAYSGERFAVASLAIKCADALIAELDREQAK